MQNILFLQIVFYIFIVLLIKNLKKCKKVQ